MVTTDIISPAVLHQSLPDPFRRTCKPVMENVQVGKAPRRPAQHASFHFIHCVPSCGWPKSPNRIPAFSSVYLRGPSNVKYRAFFDFFYSVDDVADHSSPDTETTI